MSAGTPKYRCDHARIVPVSGGTTDPRMIAANLDPLDAAVREQPVDEQPELVGGALAQRLQTPALDERVALEDAEDDVGVADVYR